MCGGAGGGGGVGGGGGGKVCEIIHTSLLLQFN